MFGWVAVTRNRTKTRTDTFDRYIYIEKFVVDARERRRHELRRFEQTVSQERRD